MKLAYALGAALSSLAAAQGSVHVVDSNEGAGFDFAQIHDAVAAASDGDILLVRAGGYEPFTIDGKSLAVTREKGVDVRIVGATIVRNLTADQSVVLHGLRSVSAPEEGLVVEDCEGVVWIEECRWVGAAGGPNYSGARVANTERAVFVRGNGQGGGYAGSLGNFSSWSGGSGITSELSSVYVWEMGLEGRRGGDADVIAGSGGSGIEAVTEEGDTIFVAGSRLYGSFGGAANGDYDFWCRCTICGLPGEGGDGISIEGPKTTTVAVRDNVYRPGDGGGTHAIFDCLPADDGVDISTSNPNTPVFDYGPGVPRFATSGPTREGQPIELVVTGGTGDLVTLLVARAPTAAWLDSLAGALALLQPATPVAFGVIPESGTLTKSFSAPSLPPAIEAAVLYAQPIHLGLDASVELSTPSALIVVDDALQASH